MAFVLKGRFWPLVCIAMVSATSASANCDAANTLAQIYNIYTALVIEDDDPQKRAAARLYPTLSNLDPERFAATIDFAFNDIRWASIHRQASTLAREVSAGIPQSDQRLGTHTDNLNWLNRTILNSGCDLSDITTNGERAFGASGGFLTQAVGKSNAPAPVKKETITKVVSILSIIAFLCGLAGFIFAILVRRHFKIRRMQRLPRQNVAFDFKIEQTGANPVETAQSVTAVDVSLGGMKIRIENTLLDGAKLVLKLAVGDRGASVVWSNNFYAGLLFDDQLTQDELDELLA